MGARMLTTTPPLTWRWGKKEYRLYFTDSLKRFCIYKCSIRGKQGTSYEIWRYRMTEKGHFRLPHADAYMEDWWIAADAEQVKEILQRKWNILRLEGIYS